MKTAQTEDAGTAAIDPAGEPARTTDDGVSLTPEGIEELKGQAAKAREYWDQLVRTTADLENYKKRATREKQDAIRYANETLLQRLIGVLDNFDMALSAAGSSNDPAVKSVQTGVTMIQAQLRQALAESGLEEIDALGKPFDPNLHEAISQQERADVPEGQVVQQTRKGFKLRDRLLRPASVIVSRKPTA